MRLISDLTDHDRSDHPAGEPTNPITRTEPPRNDRPAAGPVHRRVPATTVAIGAVLAVLAALTTGCTSSTTPTTTTATTTSAAGSSDQTAGSSGEAAGKEQVCAARDQLKTSVTALTNVSLLAQGTTAIKAAVAQVQSDLAAVKTAGKEDYATEVDATQSAVDQLQTAAGNLGSGDIAENLQAVGTAIAATGTAAEDLFTKLSTSCGN